MNKTEIELLDKTIKAVAMISDRLDVVFKAVEVLQKHIIKDRPKITYDTRIDMIKDNHSNDCECLNCHLHRSRDYIDESDQVDEDYDINY